MAKYRNSQIINFYKTKRSVVRWNRNQNANISNKKIKLNQDIIVHTRPKYALIWKKDTLLNVNCAAQL